MIGSVTIQFRGRLIEVEFDYFTNTVEDEFLNIGADFAIRHIYDGVEISPVFNRYKKMYPYVNPTEEREWKRKDIWEELEEAVLSSEEFSTWRDEDYIDDY